MLRLASVLWRLRRATGVETALFASVAARPDCPTGAKAKIRRYIEIARVGANRLVLVETREHHTPDSTPRQVRSAPTGIRRWQWPSCALPSCRPSRSIGSAATSTCSGDKPASLSSRWNCSDAAGISQSAQAFRFHSECESLMTFPSSGDRLCNGLILAKYQKMRGNSFIRTCRI